MYRLHRAGGRVKSAGLGLDLLYPEEAERYGRDPSPERAGQLRAAFRRLQKNPPLPLLAAFFPQDRGVIRQHLGRSGLYRPFLKTDQGPPGTFLPFVTGEGGAMRSYRITRREGVAVPEAHLADALAASPAARLAAERVRSEYRGFRLEECAEALEELATHVGYRRRDADVGRGLFFFCNASAADEPIVVPEHVCAEVERRVNRLVERAEAKAAHARELYRGGASVADALGSARAAEPAPSALYLQADVYLTLDGGIEIDQVQLPDLGLFLTELAPDGYEILPQVQQVVRSLRERTAELLAGLPSPTYLLTRPAVLHAREDTLEHLEIQAFRRMASAVGLDLRVATTDDVPRLPAGAQVLLLNVSPGAPGGEALLDRTARGEIACAPDPFLKLLAPELTTLRRVPVGGEQLGFLLRAIRPGAQMNQGSCHEMHRGIERIYRRGKLEGDVLHVEVPGEGTHVPTMRHSVHSFTSLYNTCNRNGFPDVWIREVPDVRRRGAVVHGDGGPHLAAFRFYFTRS